MQTPTHPNREGVMTDTAQDTFVITRSSAESFITAKSMRDELNFVLNHFTDEALVRYSFRMEVKSLEGVAAQGEGQ